MTAVVAALVVLVGLFVAGDAQHSQPHLLFLIFPGKQVYIFDCGH
jgi:hypothetical protein